MILRHDFAAMNALLWGETSNPDWSALVSGATSPDPLPPLAEIEDGLDEPDEPLTGRARFEAERADRIDSDLSWSGDPEPEVW